MENAIIILPVTEVGEDESAPGAPGAGSSVRVTIDLAGRVETTDHHPGATILQTARQIGLDPPFSCEAGNCATCMGRLLEGTVEMHVNDALDDDEVEAGFILTCQSVPTSPTVSVRYGYD
jgi:ferredoxin